MKALRHQLWTALSEPDPTQKIILIQKSVDDHVRHAINNKVWPWEPLPPREEIAPELRATLDEIRANFMHIWAAHLVMSS
jgi:hypothetical protein